MTIMLIGRTITVVSKPFVTSVQLIVCQPRDLSAAEDAENNPYLMIRNNGMNKLEYNKIQ